MDVSGRRMPPPVFMPTKGTGTGAAAGDEAGGGGSGDSITEGPEVCNDPWPPAIAGT